MNTLQKAQDDIFAFLKSNEKCMLITGTHQFKKHILVMASLEQEYENARILFRTNLMGNLLNRNFLGRFIKKPPKAGEAFQIENNIYYADSFTNRGTWAKVRNIDFAIIYPIDAMTRGSVSTECIDDLIEYQDIKKIFLVSWTDTSKEYSVFSKYIDAHTIYDAEEEDIDYHKRVLELND